MESITPNPTSVEGTPAVGCAAQTRDLVILDGELVVVSDLFTHGYVALGVDDDLLLSAKADYFCIAVRLRKEMSTTIMQHSSPHA